MDGWGTGRHSPARTLPAMATSTPHTGCTGSGCKRRPGGCRFRRGNGRGQLPGTKASRRRALPRRTSERPRRLVATGNRWERVTSHPRTPSHHILCRTDPASEHVRAARCDPSRQSGQARSSGYLRTNPPAGPSPSPTWSGVKRWRATTPLRDAASTPRRRDSHTWVTPRRREDRHPHPTRESRASP